MDLIATKSLPYAGKRYEVGDSFEANNRDARILVAIGKAKVAEAVEAEAPEPAVALNNPKAKAKAKGGARSYKRRDMTAEKGSD